ncbi:MAG: mannosyltransferase family protein [Chloroflexota bacterium]
MTAGAKPGLLSRLPLSLREALVLFAIVRIALSVYGLAASFLFQLPPPCFHNGVVDWPTMPVLYSDGLAGRLLGVWERWDACWYLRIASFGYEAGDPGTAFFPVLPVLIRVVGFLVGGNLVVAALVVVGVGYVAAMAILHRMVSDDIDGGTADRSILYLSIFPTAFFLFAPFTESIFLAFALGAIYLVRTGRASAAVPLALLAGLTRPQGVLLAVPLAWEAIAAFRAGRSSRDVLLRSLAAAAPIVGFVAFVAFTATFFGLSPSDAVRQHWGYSLALPWDVLGYAVRWILEPPSAGFGNIQALTAFHLVAIGGFCALFVVGLRKIPLTYSLYVAPQLLLLVIGGPATPLASASRYMLAMFPIFVVLGRLGRSRSFNTAWVIGSTLGLGLLFVAILQNAPVG